MPSKSARLRFYFIETPLFVKGFLNFLTRKSSWCLVTGLVMHRAVLSSWTRVKGAQQPPSLCLPVQVTCGTFTACPQRPESGGCGSSSLYSSHPFTRDPALCESVSDSQEGSPLPLSTVPEVGCVEHISNGAGPLGGPLEPSRSCQKLCFFIPEFYVSCNKQTWCILQKRHLLLGTQHGGLQLDVFMRHPAVALGFSNFI